LRGSKSPKTLPNGDFQQNENVEQLFNDRDRGKMSPNNPYKSDQNKSNGDVISGLPRSLVAKTTAGQNLTD
jgi:hypothetical protein